MVGTNYVALNETATTEEQYEIVNVKVVALLKNDDASNDLLISFDNPVSENNYLRLEPNQFIENWGIGFINKVYYKSASGNVAFRFWGLK